MFFRHAAGLLLGLFVLLPAFAQKPPPKQPNVPPEHERAGGPYVPTPAVVVDRMLALANVGPRDYVMDLGSGDGVIVITAAQKLQASGMGVDIDEELVRLSNERAKKLGIAERVRFEARDIFKTDVSKATVVTLYLLPEFMRAEFGTSFYFGGTSLLIVVVVVMDFIAQIQSHLMSHQYESLLKKTNFKGMGTPPMR